MSVERGLVMFIQAGLAGSPPVTPPPGGFFVSLPKDQISVANPKAWAYRGISAMADYTLEGRKGRTDWNVQIDCHGYTAKDAIGLAKAIDLLFAQGFRGNFPDPDSTYIFNVHLMAKGPDGFSDADRSYVRSIEYQITYQQT